MQETQFDSWVGKIRWRRDRLPTPVFLGFTCGSAGKESTCNAGDLSLISGLGKSPEEGKGYPLQYFGLENSMDYTVAKSRTQLSDWTELTELNILLPGSLMAMFSVCFNMGEGSRELSGVCFIKILISFMKTYDLIIFQEPYIQYHNLEDEDSSSELWGDINLQSIASLHIFLLSLIILAHTSHK